MGLVYTVAEITNLTKDGGRFKASFLVDTGSIDSIIPSNELERIGVARERKRSYELANGSIVTYDVGFAIANIEDEMVVTNVIFGEEGCEPLIGVTALLSAGFVVDPTRNILKKSAAIPLKSRREA